MWGGRDLGVSLCTSSGRDLVGELPNAAGKRHSGGNFHLAFATDGGISPSKKFEISKPVSRDGGFSMGS